MTRSDYYTVALALTHAKPTNDCPREMRAWERTVRIMANTLEAENPRLDAACFATACTIATL